MRFKVVVTGWNCARFVPRCVQSIARQSDTAHDVCLVDDASDEPEQAPLMREAARRFGWLHIINRRRRGALYNQYQAVRRLQPKRRDVIVFLDADDRFAGDHTLRRLRHYYESYQPLVTYGSYDCDPSDTAVTPALNFPADVVRSNAYRSFSARNDPDAIWFNHLRTVTFELFSRLQVSDFTCTDGTWFRACCDIAVMVPCLEMAGGRHLMIPEVLYTYTRNNPLSDCFVNHYEIEMAHRRILSELPAKQPLLPIVQPVVLPQSKEAAL